jgi:hypothetical protein
MHDPSFLFHSYSDPEACTIGQQAANLDKPALAVDHGHRALGRQGGESGALIEEQRRIEHDGGTDAVVDHGREGLELIAEDREEPAVCLSAQLVPRLLLPLQRHGSLPRRLRDMVDVLVAHADVP